MLAREFFSFLKEYNVISFAVGFIMGSASTALINSLVKDILLPLITAFLSTESWRTAAWEIGSTKIVYGAFLAESLNFLILALVIFIVVHKLLKMEKQK